MSRKSVQSAFRAALKQSGIHKKATYFKCNGENKRDKRFCRSASQDGKDYSGEKN
jgi:hypothetical protein